MKVFNIIGARPNIMKVASLWRAEKRYHNIKLYLIHTGQHSLSATKSILDELELPKPDFYFGKHDHFIEKPLELTNQFSSIVEKFARLFSEIRPDLVVVVGDVNSTLACALVSSRFNIPIAHVEAGQRSNDRTMPEEINRIITDHLSTYLFTPTMMAKKNLVNEGIPDKNIHFVGNTMIDTLIWKAPTIDASPILVKHKLQPNNYVVFTLHRYGNINSRQKLSSIIKAVEILQEDIKVIFPIHPHTKIQLDEMELTQQLISKPNLILTGPIDYISFIKLLKESKFVMTDSGGVQDETTFLGKPCLTLRDNTERPETTLVGTNIIIGTNTDTILHHAKSYLQKEPPFSNRIPELWDGHASDRIMDILFNKNMRS